jgi:hypothetical protein
MRSESETRKVEPGDEDFLDSRLDRIAADKNAKVLSG